MGYFDGMAETMYCKIRFTEWGILMVWKKLCTASVARSRNDFVARLD